MNFVFSKKLKLFLILLNLHSIMYAQHEEKTNTVFARADSIAATYEASAIENLPVLVHNLTANLASKKEKFRAIYMWVSTHIKNDYYAYERVKKNHQKFSEDTTAFLKWNSKQFFKALRNIRKHQKASCTGYAYLIQHMAQLANIECVIVNGYGKTATTLTYENSLPNHSWNAVFLENKWYLCDATWSAGKVVFDEGLPRFEFDYNDGFFLAEPSQFALNHYPLKKDWLLLNEPLSFEDFVERPLVYNYAFQFGISPIKPLKMHNNIKFGTPFKIKLNTRESIKYDLQLRIFKNGNSTTANPKITVINDEISITHTFLKTGLYDIHLLYNEKPIVTYVLEVYKN
ncbi:transglutaminase domain-containing protein [Croceivirga lutea]|uniref:transglutaminase domain-containing protein n=1 Tax=Croceivirga lutea TaxID=1775167 RepID=UPI00163A3DF8|nr:transglutaminase domain-containing protein [Croceivirga lutea]